MMRKRRLGFWKVEVWESLLPRCPHDFLELNDPQTASCSTYHSSTQEWRQECRVILSYILGLQETLWVTRSEQAEITGSEN